MQNDKSATLIVYDSYVDILGIEIFSTRNHIQAANQVEVIRNLIDNTFIRLQKNANDPQLNVVLDTYAIDKFRIILSISLGFLISLTLGMILYFKKYLIKLATIIEIKSLFIVEHIKIKKFTLSELAILLSIGAVSNIYFLANFSFSIDDENGALRGGNSIIWIAQGRWTAFLIEKFLFPQSAIPYAPYIALIVCLAISYALIVRAHNYPVNWKTYGTYAIFCTFPTWWLISEFYANVPAASIGVLLVSISAYLSYLNSKADQLESTSTASINIFIIATLASAIGAYQSLILLYLTIIAGIGLIKTLRTDGNSDVLKKQIFNKIFRIFLITVSSLLLYFLINYIAQKLSNTSSPYIDGFIKFDKLIQSPLSIFTTAFLELWQIYRGASSRFGADIPLTSILLIFSTLLIMYTGRRKIILTVLLWCSVLTLPFTLHLVAGGDMPLRSMFALPYVFWLMGIILISNTRTIIVLMGIFVIVFFQLEVISVTSQYIASASITQAHDRMLAADIYRRIGEAGANFDRNKPIKVDVYGHKKLSTVYAAAWSSAIQGSFFDWDQGNLFRMINYMKVMGYENIFMIDDQERQQLTPYFNFMPSWPALGSVKKVGDRYLIKLSQDPDPFHAQFIPTH
ncbi:glucosyltransferase domain-containing protein [Glaciimonas sp. GNP009]